MSFFLLIFIPELFLSDIVGKNILNDAKIYNLHP